MTDPGKARRPGRPRSERSRQAVLTAALELLTDKGLQALTMDDIAAHAGVSKNTIYRWWPSKAAVLMDAFAGAINPKIGFPPDGDAITRLRAQVRRVAQMMSDPQVQRPLVALIAASQHDPELATALHERFITARRAAACQLISTAAEQGEFAPGLDAAVIIDAVYGALYYRLLVSHAPVSPDYADRLIDTLAPALRTATLSRARPGSSQAAHPAERITAHRQMHGHP